MAAEVLLPWERLLWSGRPLALSALLPGRVGVRYLLTDFRLVLLVGARIEEIALCDIADVRRTETRLDGFLGTSTITVDGGDGRSSVILRGVRRGAQLAALLELLSGDRAPTLDREAVHAAVSWDPVARTAGKREALAGAAAALIATFAVAIGSGGHAGTAPAYSPDDSIFPGGHKKSRGDIVRFMESEVMPWASAALAPLKRHGERITCATCHGRDGATRGWQMPSVAALPQPDVKDRGWEYYGGNAMDAQMRNAIYGYVADSDKQTKASYMREVVMPGMARLLRRPAYDFTRSYEYNRSRQALGCYHCHRVK